MAADLIFDWEGKLFESHDQQVDLVHNFAPLLGIGPGEMLLTVLNFFAGCVALPPVLSFETPTNGRCGTRTELGR